MSVCANLRQLQVAGAVLTIAALLGLVGFNATFVSKINQSWTYRREIMTTPSQLSVSYTFSWAVGVIAAVTAVVLLLPALLTLFGMHNIVTTILYIVGAVFYIGVVVAGVVSIVTVKAALSRTNTILEDTRNVNDSSALLTYVLGYWEYQIAKDNTARALPATERKTSASPRAEETIGDQCLEETIPYTLLNWNTLALEATKKLVIVEGAWDANVPRYRVYVSKLPFTNETKYSDSGLWEDYFAESPRMTFAYGVKIDAGSLDQAVAAQDLCLLKVTAKGVAPEWTESDVANYWCEEYTACVLAKAEEKTREDDFKNKKCGEFDGRYHDNACYLPANWNSLDKLKDYVAEGEADYLGQILAGLFTPDVRFGILVYYSSNLQPIIFGAAGIAVLIIGLVAGCIAGNDSDKD